MSALRFLFAPELTRPLTDAVRSSAELVRRMRPFRLPVPANAPPNVAHETRKENRPRLTKKRALSCIGLLVLLAGAVFVGLGIAGLLLAEPAAAQTIDRGLFADADQATRDVLAFLGDIGAGRSSVLGDMLFVFNGGVLALAGFLLVWHTVSGTFDTAREGRFGFGAWEIVRIVAAVALMRALGESSEDASTASRFSDVPSGTWYVGHVERLADLGITSVESGGAFRPDDELTRLEMAVWMSRAFDFINEVTPEGVFTDVSADEWYAGAVEGLLAAGVTRGCSADPIAYCPNDPVRRDEMASFIARALVNRPQS